MKILITVSLFLILGVNDVFGQGVFRSQWMATNSVGFGQQAYYTSFLMSRHRIQHRRGYNAGHLGYWYYNGRAMWFEPIIFRGKMVPYVPPRQ